MAKICTLSFMLLLYLQIHAQGDMLVIRKHGHNYKTFIAGSIASFITNSGEAYTSRIEAIKNDSIFFKQITMRQVPTQWGVFRTDTVATFLQGIHYTDIVALPKKRKFTQISLDGLLMLGGAGYLAVNLINAAYLRYPPFAPDNLKNNILPAAGAFAMGFFLSKLKRDYYPLGKKYTLHYLKVTTH